MWWCVWVWRQKCVWIGFNSIGWIKSKIRSVGYISYHVWQLKQHKITTQLFHNGCMYSLNPLCFTLCIQTAVIPEVQSRPGSAMPGRVTPVYRLKRALPASDLHGRVWIQSVFGVNLYPQKFIIVINGSLNECDTVCWHAVCTSGASGQLQAQQLRDSITAPVMQPSNFILASFLLFLSPFCCPYFLAQILMVFGGVCLILSNIGSGTS